MNQSNLLDYLRRRLDQHQPRRVSQPNLAEAGVLVALTDEKDPRVLLTRRSMQLSSHKGEVAFPGGKRDNTDPDIICTALREAEEEVCLPSNKIDVVGEMDQVVSLHGYLVTPILGVIAPDQRFKANKDELDAIFQVPLSHFLQPPVSYFERGNIRIPTYQYQDFRIWGLTAMMIAEMMNHLYDSNIPYRIPL